MENRKKMRGGSIFLLYPDLKPTLNCEIKRNCKHLVLKLTVCYSCEIYWTGLALQDSQTAV